MHVAWRQNWPDCRSFLLSSGNHHDIVHTDLCGPMDSITSSGNRYAMTVIDGFSRFFVTYLLKNKSEAAGRLKDM